MNTELADLRSAVGREAVVLAVDALCAARGVPPLGGVVVAAGAPLLQRTREEIDERLGIFALAAESTTSLPLDEIAVRLAHRTDGASQLYAALNRLIDEPGRERATLLGALLGESALDHDANEQDALQALLEIATTLDPSHARVLQVLDRLKDQVDDQHGGLLREQIAAAAPGLEPVLTGVLARATAAGTAVGYTWSGGLRIGGGTAVNKWTLSDLGSRVVGYLRLYGSDGARLE